MTDAAARAGLDDATQRELEAATLRRLLEHLRSRPDAQNIDMMTLAGFCRNCLSRWYQEAAEARGLSAIDKATAREIIYGEPYDQWVAAHQTEATPEQLEAFRKSSQGH